MKAVKIIFALLFGCNYLINIDHGTIPASTLNLKSDLGLDNVALGFLGSIVYLGLTFGNQFIMSLNFSRVSNGHSNLLLSKGQVYFGEFFPFKWFRSVPLYTDF